MSKHTERLELIAIDKLIPYANNARTHSDEQIKKIQSSLREFGFVNPVLIDKDYGIIAGHGRVEAAKREGMTEVPCVWVEHLTDVQKKAYILADNKLAELAGWDNGILSEEIVSLKALKFDTSIIGFELEDVEAMDLLYAEDDEFSGEIPENPRTEYGNIYKLGRHRLMCGDSLSSADMGRLVEDIKIDLLVTDPPCNVNYEGGTQDTLKIQNDNMDNESFFLFLSGAFINADEYMRKGAAFYIWHASRTASTFEKAINSAGWDVRQQLIWVKNSLVLGRQDYQWMHEPCFYGWKGGAPHYFTYDRTLTTKIWEDARTELREMDREQLIKLFEDVALSLPSTIIREDKPIKSEAHPTMKPIKLMERIIKNSSKQRQSVLDLFGGSGSTLIACEQLNRTCYMMELDCRYVDVIINRWETLTGQKAVKL